MGIGSLFMGKMLEHHLLRQVESPDAKINSILEKHPQMLAHLPPPPAMPTVPARHAHGTRRFDSFMRLNESISSGMTGLRNTSAYAPMSAHAPMPTRSYEQILADNPTPLEAVPYQPMRSDLSAENSHSPRPPSQRFWPRIMEHINDPALEFRPGNHFLGFENEVHDRDPLSGMTPLINAAINKKPNLFRQLLGLGARIEDTDRMGRNALSHAAAYGNIRATNDMLDMLADSDPQFRAGILHNRDIEHMTPLLRAVHMGQSETTAALLETLRESPAAAHDLSYARQLAEKNLDRFQWDSPYSPGRMAAEENVERLASFRL
jgi:hypothetical protein